MRGKSIIQEPKVRSDSTVQENPIEQQMAADWEQMVVRNKLGETTKRTLFQRIISRLNRVITSEHTQDPLTKQ